MKVLNLSLAGLMVFALGGCATSEKVQVSQIGDSQMSCSNLTEELSKMDNAQAEIDSKKGVTGTNVASTLFFLPGLVYTYYDAGEATKAVGDRRNKLVEIYERKGCHAQVSENAKDKDESSHKSIAPLTSAANTEKKSKGRGL